MHFFVRQYNLFVHPKHLFEHQEPFLLLLMRQVLALPLLLLPFFVFLEEQFDFHMALLLHPSDLQDLEGYLLERFFVHLKNQVLACILFLLILLLALVIQLCDLYYLFDLDKFLFLCLVTQLRLPTSLLGHAQDLQFPRQSLLLHIQNQQ